MGSGAQDEQVVRVLLADDSDIYRNGLARAITASPSLELVASVGGGLDAIEVAARLRPAVVVLDYRMPDLDGLATAVVIRRADPRCRVLLISAYSDEFVERLGSTDDDGRPAVDAVLGKNASRRVIVEQIRVLGVG